MGVANPAPSSDTLTRVSRLRVIYRTREPHLAFMLQSLLGDYGIRAEVIDGDALGAGDHSGRGSEVIVADADADTAAGIAALFEKHVVRPPAAASVAELSQDRQDSHWLSVPEPGQTRRYAGAAEDFGDGVVGVDGASVDGSGDGVAGVEVESTDQAWDDWPVCPRCRQRRQTVCPVCETAGRAFRRGYLPPEVAAEAVASGLTSTAFIGSAPVERDMAFGVLLLCGGCDEAFVPRFYNRCEHCGHKFDGGIQVDPRLLPESPGGAFWFGVALLVVFSICLLLMAI